MSSKPLDNLSHERAEIQTPAQLLDLSRVTCGESNTRSLNATMSAMDNVSQDLPKDFPYLSLNSDLQPLGKQRNSSTALNDVLSNSNEGIKWLPTIDLNNQTEPAHRSEQNQINSKANDAPVNAFPTSADRAASQEDQSWKSHMKDQWVKDSLNVHPDWHAMEGLHPGEIAVGNWEPSKADKKLISSTLDRMTAENNDGPVKIILPDGSVCSIQRVHNGSHGQTFSQDDTNGQTHRTVKNAQLDGSDVSKGVAPTAADKPTDVQKEVAPPVVADKPIDVPKEVAPPVVADKPTDVQKEVTDGQQQQGGLDAHRAAIVKFATDLVGKADFQQVKDWSTGDQYNMTGSSLQAGDGWWCMAFVKAAMVAGGSKNFPLYNGQQVALGLHGLDVAQPGDEVAYKSGNGAVGHVGIVTDLIKDASGKTIGFSSVEGNIWDNANHMANIVNVTQTIGNSKNDSGDGFAYSDVLGFVSPT